MIFAITNPAEMSDNGSLQNADALEVEGENSDLEILETENNIHVEQSGDQSRIAVVEDDIFETESTIHVRQPEEQARMAVDNANIGFVNSNSVEPDSAIVISDPLVPNGTEDAKSDASNESKSKSCNCGKVVLNSSVKRTYNDLEAEDDTTNTCPICLEPWTSAGDHRLCSLKCGHLFGRKCVERWLTMNKARACPQCNTKANKKDIRNLFATKLAAIDNTELEAISKELEQSRNEVAELKKALGGHTRLNQYYKELIEKQAACLGSNIAIPSPTPAAVTMVNHRIIGFFKIEENSARVLAYSPTRDLVFVSQKITTPLFTGFGLLVVSCQNWSKIALQGLHKKEIRDLAFHPRISDHILSVSFDNTAKIYNVAAKTEVATFSAETKLWCCSWDPRDEFKFYCGSGRGEICAFEMTSLQMRTTLKGDESFLPVVGVHVSSNGDYIISCRAHSVVAYIKNEETSEYSRQELNVGSGPFSSICFDDANGTMVLGCRPTAEFQFNVRHVCFDVRFENGSITCSQTHAFICGQAMNRMCRPSLLGSWYFAFNESVSAIWGWCLTSKQKKVSISMNRPVVDILAIPRDSDVRLLVLTTHDLRCFQLSS